MKRTAFLLALMPVLLAGCYPTRIVTTAPVATEGYGNYSTVVTYPRTKTSTTTTQVYARSYDISLALDLQAVAAAFAQSSTVREFESLINNASYIISNLDLNNDGYVDYLRVLETLDGYNHVFIIQAVLALDVYQDVATIVVEGAGIYDYRVEIIGAPYIYGPSYVICPVFLQRPAILPHLYRTGYERWHSPWYWDHFPSWYKRPAPVYLNHYQAYVRTFMSNHSYCHEVSFSDKPHYKNYDRVGQDDRRNDYERQHPESSFTVRNANVTTGSGSSARKVTNARDITANNNATKSTTTSSTASRSSSVSRSSSTATKSSTTGTAASRTSSSSATRSSSTSGSTRSAGSTVSGTSSSRGSSVSGSTATRSGSSTSATRSSGSTGSTGSTTVRSRVNNSGSSDTRTTTVTGSGSTTVRRGSSSSSSSSATRSSGSTVTRSSGSSSSATRTSSGTSSSTSTKSTTSATRGTRR